MCLNIYTTKLLDVLHVNGLSFLRLRLKIVWFSAEILKDLTGKCQYLTLSMTCSVSSCRDPLSQQKDHLEGQARDV